MNMHKLFDCYVLIWDLLYKMYYIVGENNKHITMKLHNIIRIMDFILIQGSRNKPRNIDRFERNNGITKTIWNKTSKTHDPIYLDNLLKELRNRDTIGGFN